MADGAPSWAAELPDPDAIASTPEKAPAWAADLADHPEANAAPAASPHARPPARPPTPYQAAAQPIAPNAPEPGWGDVAQSAARNLIPSAKGAGMAMWDAITHPIRTVKNVADVAQGMGSQAAGALGIQQDPVQKARTEALAKAVEHHYAQTYGSVAGFKKAVSTDPVSVAMDASTLLSGGAGALGRVAGLEKTAATLGRVASAVDPVTNALRVAKVASTPVRAALRGASSVATGVPGDLMKVAAQAGATSDPALRGAFLKFYTGQGDPAEFLQTAQNALGQLRQDASDAYLAKKGTLANTSPSFQPIDDAIAKARAQTMAGGVNVGQFKAANDAIDQADAMVQGWKSAPDPAYQSLLGFDNLKQAIWDLRDSTGNAAAQNHLGGIYNGVKSAIVDADPEYAKLMEQYQLGRNNITAAQKTLVGAGNAPNATLAMSKSLRALKTPTGKNLFQQLAQKEPTLPYMLAGNALHPWGASGRAGLLEHLSALPLATTAAYMAHNPVAGLGSLGAQILGQSPKVAGLANFGAGLASRVADPALTGAYYSGRVGESAPPQTADAIGVDSATDPQIEHVYENMLLRESGDRQFNADGTPKVSPAGAVGVAQIEPSTGPVAAKLAGLPWDPHRLRADPDYNRALGLAYFKALVKQYDGNVTRAVAAYNAGPGNVDRALNLAEITGQDWLSHLPSETQKYVPAVLREPHAAGGKVGAKSIDHLVEALLAKTEKVKRAQKGATKPLLNVPDAAIARALEVANRGG